MQAGQSPSSVDDLRPVMTQRLPGAQDMAAERAVLLARRDGDRRRGAP